MMTILVLCPNCKGLSPLSNKIFDQRLIENKIPIRRIGNYINSRIKMELQCLVNGCGNFWFATSNSILRGKGYPQCKWFKNQKIMIEALQKFDNNFESEYNLTKIIKSSQPYRFDLYSHKYRIAFEYDGRQHYIPVKFGGISDERAALEFKNTQKRDAYKNKFCEDNTITLIRIDGRRYINKKLENLIQEIINLLKNNYNDLYNLFFIKGK